MCSPVVLDAAVCGLGVVLGDGVAITGAVRGAKMYHHNIMVVKES